MSNVTHIFEVNSAEHHLVSTSPNLIITAQATPGEAEEFKPTEYPEYNPVAGFVSGEDKIKIPLALLKRINPDTAITTGTPASIDRSISYGDAIYYEDGVLGYAGVVSDPNEGDDEVAVPLLILDGQPALAATDIEII